MSSPMVSSRFISHTPRARSIGSQSLSQNMRFTPTTPISPPLHPTTNIDALVSPSRLPATDSLSYFPPFESMGSGPSEPEAGPSRLKHEDKENRHHAKGKSLGSLAGLMSLLSPGTSPRKGGHAPQPSRSNSDGDVLQALAKRVTPGKRRVLEPMTCLPNREEPEMDVRHRRRRTSSDIGGSRGSHRKRGTEGEGIDGQAMIPAKARRRPRPVLNMTLPALPSWRFPMSSPPITCLSPDIPLSAFSPIDNPASNPSSTDSSPAKQLTPSSLCFDYTYSDIDDDEEILVDDLSPTTSTYGTLSSGSSRPITPQDICNWDREGTSPKSLDIYGNTSIYRSKLERTVSQASCDSKETIRPSHGGFVTSSSDGEVTPKAGKAWL